MFTCADDWPYPDMMVSNAAAVDRARGKVFAYVIVSGDFRHAAVIPYDTHPHWSIMEMHASNTGNLERVYVCPLVHAKFVPL